MRLSWIGGLTLAGLAMCLAPGTRADDQIETHAYSGIKIIKINTTSGECIVRKGTDNQVKVEVTWSYRPHESYEPRFSDRGEVLKLSEEIYESNSGYSKWTLTIPDSVEIRFNSASGGLDVADWAGEISGQTASGDFRMDKCQGDFSLSSASGNVEMFSCNGEFSVSTASGDIQLIECTGKFETSSASGDVEAEAATIDAPSSFSAASGSVDVSLAKPVTHDLVLSSASGDAGLNFGGNPIQGYFEFQTRYRTGHIEAPFSFDDEEEFRDHGDRYVRKWFTRGGEKPEIFIQTASGTAALTER